MVLMVMIVVKVVVFFQVVIYFGEGGVMELSILLIQ